MRSMRCLFVLLCKWALKNDDVDRNKTYIEVGQCFISITSEGKTAKETEAKIFQHREKAKKKRISSCKTFF